MIRLLIAVLLATMIDFDMVTAEAHDMIIDECFGDWTTAGQPNPKAFVWEWVHADSPSHPN